MRGGKSRRPEPAVHAGQERPAPRPDRRADRQGRAASQERGQAAHQPPLEVDEPARKRRREVLVPQEEGPVLGLLHERQVVVRVVDVIEEAHEGAPGRRPVGRAHVGQRDERAHEQPGQDQGPRARARQRRGHPVRPRPLVDAEGDGMGPTRATWRNGVVSAQPAAGTLPRPAGPRGSCSGGRAAPPATRARRPRRTAGPRRRAPAGCSGQRRTPCTRSGRWRRGRCRAARAGGPRAGRWSAGRGPRASAPAGTNQSGWSLRTIRQGDERRCWPWAGRRRPASPSARKRARPRAARARKGSPIPTRNCRKKATGLTVNRRTIPGHGPGHEVRRGRARLGLGGGPPGGKRGEGGRRARARPRSPASGGVG